MGIFGKIYFCGLLILIAAIFMTNLEKWIGFYSWYDVLASKNSPNVLNWIFLIFVYPFVLGLITYWFWKKF